MSDQRARELIAEIAIETAARLHAMGVPVAEIARVAGVDEALLLSSASTPPTPKEQT